jgi:hypothetical protein
MFIYSVRAIIMAKFKVGDMARVVAYDAELAKWTLNKEVTILSVGNFKGLTTGTHYQYTVDCAGEVFGASDEHLEPLTGSWDEIFQATGWKRSSKLSQPSQTLVESHKVFEGMVG